MRSFPDQQRLNQVIPPITAGEQDYHSWIRDYHVSEVSVALTPHQEVFLVTTLLVCDSRPNIYMYHVSLYRTMPDGVVLRERAISELMPFDIRHNEVI